MNFENVKFLFLIKIFGDFELQINKN